MALAPIIVPTFPNVPQAPGVPPVAQSAAGALNLLTGDVTGRINNTLTGAFSGQITGSILQVSGLLSPVSGSIQGVIDGANNVAATFSGLVGGNVVGDLTGIVDPSSGFITGSLSGSATQLTGDLGPLTGDGDIPDAPSTPQWGIFDSGGSSALEADSVLAVGYRSEYRISNFPVEGGEFQSYNKVRVPYDARLTFTKGGSDADRTAFLNALEKLIKSLDLYTVITPEISYANANVVDYSYERTAANGVTLLRVDVETQEVRVSGPAQFSGLQDAKQPSGQSPQNDGAVQPELPSTANFDPANLASRLDLF